MPTFRRPVLLERALRSLVAQTHENWRAIVFDDCPDGSAQVVVERVADERIAYRRNAMQIGAIGNIDQCFHNQPFAGGEFCCILEDDNILLERHLTHALSLCVLHQVETVFCDQLCEQPVIAGEPGVLSERRTIGTFYTEGLFDAADLAPAIAFAPAFSNGSAFWRLGGACDFELGPITFDPGIQELARMMRLRGAVYVSLTPTAVWRINDPLDSFVSAAPAASSLAQALQARWRSLQQRRDVLALRDLYFRTYGTPRAIAFATAAPAAYRASIENAMLMCGRFVTLTDRSFVWRMRHMTRGLLFRVLVPKRIKLRGLLASRQRPAA